MLKLISQRAFVLISLIFAERVPLSSFDTNVNLKSAFHS